MIRICKDNIERVVAKELKNKFLGEGWNEVQPDLKTKDIEELKDLAESKGLEFDLEIKKKELIKLLESAN